MASSFGGRGRLATLPHLGFPAIPNHEAQYKDKIEPETQQCRSLPGVRASSSRDMIKMQIPRSHLSRVQVQGIQDKAQEPLLELSSPGSLRQVV